MGKLKKIKKFALNKRLMNPKDDRLKSQKERKEHEEKRLKAFRESDNA